jgi:hypothetical protein
MDTDVCDRDREGGLRGIFLDFVRRMRLFGVSLHIETGSELVHDPRFFRTFRAVRSV